MCTSSGNKISKGWRFGGVVLLFLIGMGITSLIWLGLLPEAKSLLSLKGVGYKEVINCPTWVYVEDGHDNCQMQLFSYSASNSALVDQYIYLNLDGSATWMQIAVSGDSFSLSHDAFGEGGNTVYASGTLLNSGIYVLATDGQRIVIKPEGKLYVVGYLLWLNTPPPIGTSTPTK